MSIPVSLKVEVDNTDQLRGIGPQELCRPRTIHLLLTELAGGAGYEVVVFGPAFTDGGGLLKAEIRRKPADVQAAIDQLLDQWQQHVIQLKISAGDGFVRPYGTVPAEDDSEAARRWDTTGRLLARAGNTLFRYLFHTGDRDLEVIGDALVTALNDGEQIISIHSDTLFAPWSMLYTPTSPHALLHRADASWSPEGFWGYRHLVEHQVRRNWQFRARIPLMAGSQAAIGMNVDPRLDKEYPLSPFIEPVRVFLEARAQVSVRTRKEDLAIAIAETGLAEQVMYFGCHGTSGRTPSGPAPDRQLMSHPALFLEDRNPIHPADFSNWFSSRPMGPGPIVYLDACEAGRIASFFYSSFGMTLLECGANCLIGPQIDLPVGFAKEYTCRFFDVLLKPETRIGDITRDLARDLIDRHHTPLGLIFTLHRGLDVHLGRVPA